ncbi:DUF1093 domain-containing protein [Bacillus sp. AR18-7]|nr:DUF1093 domain-containing protein [Bacillus sp. AR18-7]
MKIDGEGIKEGDAFQYTLKGFNESEEERIIQFTTNSDKPIEEGTYLKVTVNENTTTEEGIFFKFTVSEDKDTQNEVTSIKEYEVIKSENVPEKVKGKLK